jgi:SAM-dependent methyltransferase
MRRVAQARGIEVVDAVAEALPYPAETFDFAPMVTTVCFLDDVATAFREAKRVLRLGGALVVGLVDRVSPLGQAYEQQKADSVFYRGARFRSAAEVAALMQAAGFEGLTFRKTLFGDPAAMEATVPVLEGRGEGGFVVIRGTKR